MNKENGNIFEKPLYLIELGWTGPFSVVMKTEKEDFKVKADAEYKQFV